MNLPNFLNRLPDELQVFILLLSILIVGLWIWSLVDSLKRRDFKNNVEKLIWVYVIISTFFLGTLLYYFIAKRK